MQHDNDNQTSPLEIFASLAISGLALVLMIAAGYLTPDLLATIGR